MCPTAGLIGATHDVTIADRSTGSPILGLMLYRPKGKRQFSLSDYPTLAPRQLTMGELTHAELPAELALSWTQEAWYGGMGAVNHRLLNGDIRLAKGVMVDTSNLAGKIRLANKNILSTVDAVPTEYWPSGFATSGTQAWAFIGRFPFSWDYTNANWDRGTAPVAAARLYRNGIVYGSNIYVPSWAQDAGSGGLYTGSDLPTSYIYKAPTDAAWTLSTLDPRYIKYMCNAATKLWGGYVVDVADSTRDTTEAIDIGETDIDCDDPTGILAAGDIIRIDTELMLVTAVTGAPFPYITVVKGYRGTVDAAHDTLKSIYKLTSNVHHLRASTDGTNTGAWGAATTIGTSDSEITALVPYFDGTNELCLVCKTDGLWTANAGGTVVQLYNMKGQQHQDNFRGAYAWDSNQRVILPKGTTGMWELYQDTVRDISFEKVMPEQTWTHGRVLGVTADPTNIFVLVQDTTNALAYHVFKGELVAIGGVTDYRWNHVVQITCTTGSTPLHSALFAEAVPSGAIVHHRIHIGVESTGSNLLPYFYPLSSDVALVYTDDTTNPLADTVAWDANFPQGQKRYSTIDFTTANLGSGANDHYIYVQYRVDGGSWTYVTGAQATSKLTTSPQTLTFSSEVTGKKLELRFLLVRGTTTTTSPEITSFKVTAQLRLSTVDILPLTFRLEDGMLNLAGRPMYSSASDLTQLESFIDQTAEVTVVDPRGTSRSMMFLRGNVKIAETSAYYRRRPAYLASVVLATVS